MHTVKILATAIEETYNDLTVSDFADAIIRVNKGGESLYISVNKLDLLAQWNGGSSRIKLSHPDILGEIRQLIDRI